MPRARWSAYRETAMFAHAGRDMKAPACMMRYTWDRRCSEAFWKRTGNGYGMERDRDFALFLASAALTAWTCSGDWGCYFLTHFQPEFHHV